MTNRCRADEPWYRPLAITAAVFAGMVLIGAGAVISLRSDAAKVSGPTNPPVQAPVTRTLVVLPPPGP